MSDHLPAATHGDPSVDTTGSSVTGILKLDAFLDQAFSHADSRLKELDPDGDCRLIQSVYDKSSPFFRFEQASHYLVQVHEQIADLWREGTISPPWAAEMRMELLDARRILLHSCRMRLIETTAPCGLAGRVCALADRVEQYADDVYLLIHPDRVADDAALLTPPPEVQFDHWRFQQDLSDLRTEWVSLSDYRQMDRAGAGANAFPEPTVCSVGPGGQAAPMPASSEIGGASNVSAAPANLGAKNGKRKERPFGNGGPIITPEQRDKAAAAGRRYLDQARAKHRDVKQPEILDILRTASGRESFSVASLLDVLPEWREFRVWANSELRGRKAKVNQASASQVNTFRDRSPSSDPAVHAENADECRQQLMNCANSNEERARIRGMRAEEVIELRTLMNEQEDDNCQRRIGPKDRRSPSRSRRS
jgi:hypothetical protein